MAAAAGERRLLVLGGGRFVGLTIVEAAVEQGWDVTVFNRGKTSVAPPAGATLVKGDRTVAADLEALASSGPFDAIVDCCCYLPGDATSATTALRAAAAPTGCRLVFVSSVSVYSKEAIAAPGASEGAALAVLPEGKPRDKYDGETYGPLKAECEAAVRAAWLDGGGDEGGDADESAASARGGGGAAGGGTGHRSLVVLRPGLIVGPRDTTDRFTYWPARAARGGRMVAPAPAAVDKQVVDVRDLAAFTMRCCQPALVPGSAVFNVVGPVSESNVTAASADATAAVVPRVTMGEIVQTCVDAAAATSAAPDHVDTEVVWVDEDFLVAQDVKVWVGLPLWFPASAGGQPGLLQVSAAAAIERGLRSRPFADTVADTLAWHSTRPLKPSADADDGGGADDDWKLSVGISSSKEAAVLAAWDARPKPSDSES